MPSAPRLLLLLFVACQARKVASLPRLLLALLVTFRARKVASFPRLLLALLVACQALAMPSAADARPHASRDVGATDTDPSVELLTMGQSPAVYHRFGHAALCIIHRAQPDNTRCFNYGATDFEAPAHKIGWAFLRGTARFWVSVHSYELMLWAYREDDRDIYIQRIPFTQAQVARLAARLDNDAKEENRYYLYHHFYDNCATRLRDHLNAVSGGALWWKSERGIGLTFRDIGERGLAGRTEIIAGARFLLGRRLDREVTVWHSMFHPDYLRTEVAKRLGAPPIQVYARRGPPVPTEGSRGLGWVALLALFLALPLAVVRGVSLLCPLRHLALFERLALALPALALTLLALIIHCVVLLSTLPEARWNEAALFFWPTDLALVILGARRRRIYARVRLAAMGLFALALAVGLLHQPLWVPLLLPALPCALLAWNWGKAAPPKDTPLGDPGADDREPMADDGRPMADDREPMADDREPMADDREPMADDGRPMADDREPMADDREPMTDDGCLMADGRGPRAGDRGPDVRRV